MHSSHEAFINAKRFLLSFFYYFFFHSDFDFDLLLGILVLILMTFGYHSVYWIQGN